MRLVQVAKTLGMTGQQLRKELTGVDFGVKPTDREVPDNLAQGIIRYFAREKGIEIDMEALGFGSDDGGVTESTSAPQEVTAEKKSDKSEEVSTNKKSKPTGVSKKELNVLRKLSLDDVSKDAIAAQKQKLITEQDSSGRRKKVVRKGAAEKRPRATEQNQEQIKKKEGVVQLPAQISVKEFAEKAGVQVPQVVQALMSNGVMATVTQSIDYDTAAIVADELGVQVAKLESLASAEDILSRNLEELLADEPENLTKRPPIVVVMGHVDHGKTSILDVIRETDVVAGEAGGITQHIGAYQVHHTSKGGSEPESLTFLDTPGHEAFTAMRARGAQVTDIVVLVVAADEGVKPTTVEAIDHAKDAGVPILVALNKMDKEGADPERVKGELAAHDLQPEDWGGKTPVIPVSAKSKKGIDELIDSILVVAEMAELKANANRAAVGTIVESHLDLSLGALATVIVSTGTLRVGDAFVCGETPGKVRTLTDEHGTRVEEVLPSGAAQISGFDDVVQVGDILQVVPSEQQARQLTDAVREQGERGRKRSFADLVSRLSEGKLKQLKVVLKADAQGSLDAIRDALSKMTTDEVSVKVIHAAIGAVSETDVMMASASDGVVVAFNVTVPSAVGRAAEREGVKVQEYDIIYNLLDDIDGLLGGLVEPEETEKVYGHLELKAVFMTKKSEQVVGGKVTDGLVKRLPFRVMREGEEVGTGRITSLRHVERDIKEAKEGTECGARTESTVALQEGDALEVFLKELKKKG